MTTRDPTHSGVVHTSDVLLFLIVFIVVATAVGGLAIALMGGPL